jgi:hypothetical protein
MGAALTRGCLPGLRQVARQNRSQDRLENAFEIPNNGERTEVVGKFAKFDLPYKTGLLADPGHMIACRDGLAAQHGPVLGMRPEWLRIAARRSVRSSKCGRNQVAADPNGDVVERDGYDAWGSEAARGLAGDAAGRVVSPGREAPLAEEELKSLVAERGQVRWRVQRRGETPPDVVIQVGPTGPPGTPRSVTATMFTPYSNIASATPHIAHFVELCRAPTRSKGDPNTAPLRLARIVGAAR